MGCTTSKRYAEMCAEARALGARVLALEEETREARRARDEEALAHEQRLAALARQQGEAVRALKRKLEEEETRRRALEAAAGCGCEGVNCREQLRRPGARRVAGRVLVMKAEQARSDQAAERWKQLYLAIKAELDDLILQTWQGERMCWAAGEDVIGRLQSEVKAKEETVEALRSRLEAAEEEGAKRGREVDILRQSLRILSNKNKRGRARKNFTARIFGS